jgi:DNA helicase HerA-like ATPase
LGSPKAQQIFVGQLTQAYFAWAKKRPTNHPQGLLVIDEAKEFAPALKTTPAKTALIRFASQARKYGLGLILATQEPKSVDNQIIGNCNTQFFGRLSSPTSIGTAEKLLGYSGVIGNLKQGNFFVKSTETIQKLSVTLGLSYHFGPADDRLINQLANQTKLACLNKN